MAWLSRQNQAAFRENANFPKAKNNRIAKETQGVKKKRLQKWHLKTSKTKNLYHKDAKYAKKHQTSPDFLSSFALFAS